MSTTRSGQQASAQIGKMGVITGLPDNSFSLSDGQCFNVKNDGTSSVYLEVQLAGMPDGDFVLTRFDPGWNPEIIRVIKLVEIESMNIKWGY